VRCLVAFCPVNNEALEGELTLCAYKVEKQMTEHTLSRKYIQE
jgi:hypothetical protein